jgi:large subunit ribosomal protein L21
LKKALLSASKNAAFLSASLSEREVLFVFAVIETGGKQYKVIEQDIIFVEKLDVNEGDEIVFDSVKALSNDNGFKVGAPNVDGAKVTAKVLKNGKNKKIYVMKYKPKKNEKKKIGHRQPYTKVQITTIEG